MYTVFGYLIISYGFYNVKNIIINLKLRSLKFLVLEPNSRTPRKKRIHMLFIITIINILFSGLLIRFLYLKNQFEFLITFYFVH